MLICRRMMAEVIKILYDVTLSGGLQKIHRKDNSRKKTEESPSYFLPEIVLLILNKITGAL